MAEVTTMVLKVDLGCYRCYRKIKKLLCKYPEIRDHTFIEKEDTVIIKVVCCCPERIREKLICKGGKTIKSIEIKVPEKPEPPPGKPKPPPEKKDEPKLIKPPPPRPPAPVPTTTTVGGYPAFYPVTLPTQSYDSYDVRHSITYQPPSSYNGYVREVASYDEPYGSWPSGCRCNRSYGCRCEYFTEENPNPACTIM